MRIVDIEAPKLQGTVVEASERRAAVETASGRVELAVSGAAPGMRVTATATEIPPPPVPVPLVREALVAATPDSGPAVAVRIVSIEAPQIRGTVVEATENSAVLETATVVMRFVLDLELSALGPLQLSGLVRERRFDLIVHSQRPLAAGTQQEIQSIFAEGSELGNATGNLAFRSGPPYPSSPVREAGSGGGREIKT
jgi:hypothetical protein